mmetsp:Transcript_4651/g.12552  ORF Transcript_4651/g.12552 Transcript_4651/m.12552 type:complete len:91 (-) Transcript_4651:381-653(-)
MNRGLRKMSWSASSHILYCQCLSPEGNLEKMEVSFALIFWIDEDEPGPRRSGSLALRAKMPPPVLLPPPCAAVRPGVTEPSRLDARDADR